MKANKGITLANLVLTVVILSIVTAVTINVGTTTYENAEVASYVATMNLIQARVNVVSQKIKDGDTEYSQIGTEITQLDEATQAKITLAMGNTSQEGFKYYNETALEELGLSKIEENVVINLETREIFSVVPVKYEDVLHYNQYNLPNGTQIIEYSELETVAPQFTIEKLNYGLTTEVRVTNIIYDEQISGSDIYYGEVIDDTTTPVTVSHWMQAAGTGFAVTKTATYAVKVVDKNGGETIKTVDVVTCNAPELTTGMVPVIYENGNWKKVDTDEMGKWYDYAEKKWANVMLSDGLEIADDGTITSMGSMFVWIPRYAYCITSGYQTAGTGTIDVRFLKNLTYVTTEEKTTVMSDEAGANKWIVHPAFKDGSENDYAEGGWDRELEGFWVAKFEASGVDEDGNAVGVASESTSTTTYVRSVPGVQSWRYISIGESQYKSMQMDEKSVYGWTSESVDSHLIKNDEWGAVAYLCYSQYGEVPLINGASNYYTGAGPIIGTTRENASENGNYTYTSEHAYNTENGMLASTTGNVYGIYDLAGGTWEVVAGYLNNGNSNLGQQGKSSTNTNCIYFFKNEAKSTENYEWYELEQRYNKYWSKYEVGDEERNNQIKINDDIILTQKQLFDVNLTGSEYNTARLRITTETYRQLAKCKGIGINEVASSFSYYGAYNDGTKNTMHYFTDIIQPTNKQVTLGRAWDGDWVLIAHGNSTFIARGGNTVDLFRRWCNVYLWCCWLEWKQWF